MMGNNKGVELNKASNMDCRREWQKFSGKVDVLCGL
jgi:hypothetical protein